MFSTNYIIDAILENDALTEQWLEFALVLEEAGELAGAALALDEAIEYEEWKLTWQERLITQESDELMDAEMLRFLWLDLPDADCEELEWITLPDAIDLVFPDAHLSDEELDSLLEQSYASVQ